LKTSPELTFAVPYLQTAPRHKGFFGKHLPAQAGIAMTAFAIAGFVAFGSASRNGRNPAAGGTPV
jgi:hypothetical protein